MAEKMVDDSAKRQSLHKHLSRWICLSSDAFIPAFPHEGTSEDVERIKSLLKMLSMVFLNGNDTCPPFYLQSQNAMPSPSEQTGEGDNLQATLKCMVQTLKQLESFLVKNCALPTVHEVRLYGLILRHIESYMLLYLMEESSRQDAVPMELFDDAAQKVSSFLSDNHINVDESVLKSFGDCSSDFFHVWNGFCMLVSILQDFTSSILKMSADEGLTISGSTLQTCATNVKAGVGEHTFASQPLVLTKNFGAGEKGKRSEEGSFDFKGTMKKRKLDTGVALGVDEMTPVATESGGKVMAAEGCVKLLLNILRGLQGIGRMRSYAPPLPEEMKYYRLMWAHVMFTLGFINSKCRAGKRPALPGGMKNWVYKFLSWSSESVDRIPDGWKLTFTLEAIPDLITIMKLCEDHLSDHFGAKANVVERGSESKWAELKHQIHRFDTLTVDVDSGKLVHQNDERKTLSRTRIECLRDILCILKSTSWDGLPTTEERRLYARLLDHVDSSIWMYESAEWLRKAHLPSWTAESGYWSLEEQKPGVEMGASSKRCDCVTKGLSADSDGREKAREHCLHEIVLFVEAIESSFLDCVPTAQEMSCYQEIQQHMDKNFMRTAPSLMAQIFPEKPHLLPHHIAVMDHHVKCFLELKRKALKPLDEECRKMLARIFFSTSLDWGCGKQFIGAMSPEDHTAVVEALHEAQSCGMQAQESLELATMIVGSARMCADRVFERLIDAEEQLQNFTHMLKYEKGMDEVGRVPGVLRALFEFID